MQGEGILQTIAEVSVAFAGFTGVVVAFGRRPDQGDSSIDSLAFRAMLASSFQALFFAVFPFLLDAIGLTEPHIWRVASGFLLLGLIAGASADVYLVRRVQRHLLTGFDRSFRIAIPLFGLPTMAFQVLNISGAFDRAFAPYLGGLIFFLFFSSVMFVRLLIISRIR